MWEGRGGHHTQPMQMEARSSTNSTACTHTKRERDEDEGEEKKRAHDDNDSLPPTLTEVRPCPPKEIRLPGWCKSAAAPITDDSAAGVGSPVLRPT